MTEQKLVPVPRAGLEEARDLLLERVRGNPARSAAHNAPSGWRSMESAPRDGTSILGCWKLAAGPLFGVISWGEGIAGDEWADGSAEGWREGGDCVAGLTHWMPLPEAPGSAAPSPDTGSMGGEAGKRLAEIAAAIEFAPGDGISFRETGAVQLAADIRSVLSEGEAATCQACGGEIQGWCCQSCDKEFKENDAGRLVFTDHADFAPVSGGGGEAVAVDLEELRSAIHAATHHVLPFAEVEMKPFSVKERAGMQVEIADHIIANIGKAITTRTHPSDQSDTDWIRAALETITEQPFGHEAGTADGDRWRCPSCSYAWPFGGHEKHSPDCARIIARAALGEA